MAKTRKSKAPRVGSRAWERSLVNSPNFIRETFKSIVERASAGNAEAAAFIPSWLARHPELRSTVRQLDDLRTQVEAVWIKVLAAGDLVREQAVREEIALLRGELLGENSSVMDQVLASNVIVAYLANQAASLCEAKPTDYSAVAAARARRTESTQRRFHSAVKTLTLIRSAMTRGLRPPANIKLLCPAG
jgi:hypothetical protein